MAKNTSGEVAAKTSSKNPAKKDLTLKEAFEIVRNADAEIKEIYGTRTFNDVNIDNRMEHHTFKTFAIYGTSSGALCFATVLTQWDFLVPLVASGFGYSALLFVMSGLLSKHKVMAPFKYRKVVAEHTIHDQLIEFHEETMAEQAKAVLKKAKKALKVVNAALKEDGQSVYFNTTKGEEGFVLKQPESFDQFEMAYLRVSKKQTQQKLELVGSEVKALEAKTAA